MLLIRDLLRHIRDWDNPSRLSLAIAVTLLLIAIGFAVFGSPEFRFPTMVVIVGLIVVMQIVIMWGNRGLVTPYTQAQRSYLRGDFEQARIVLEKAIEAGRPNVATLTLLGNTYRQLGDLSQSETVLQQALHQQSESHFAAYGLGMTLMAQGEYDKAIVMIRQSLRYGAPSVVKFDLGHCLYRCGDMIAAQPILLDILESVQQEPHRHLMREYILFQLDAGERPQNQLIHDGLAFWEASAKRYQSTDYGQTLLLDVQQMQHWAEEA